MIFFDLYLVCRVVFHVASRVVHTIFWKGIWLVFYLILYLVKFWTKILQGQPEKICRKVRMLALAAMMGLGFDSRL